MNINDKVYAQESTGFCVVTSDTPTRHCGGEDLFYKESLFLAVEDHQYHSLNVSSFQLLMGVRRFYMVD